MSLGAVVVKDVVVMTEMCAMAKKKTDARPRERRRATSRVWMAVQAPAQERRGWEVVRWQWVAHA